MLAQQGETEAGSQSECLEVKESNQDIRHAGGRRGREHKGEERHGETKIK